MANLLVIESAGAPFFTSKFIRMKELGHTIIVVRHELPEGFVVGDLIDDFIPVRVHNFEDFDLAVSQIIDYTKEMKIDGVLTRWDACIPVLSKVSEYLGIETIPSNVGEILRCKDTMREAFKEWGLPSAEFERVNTINQALHVADRIGFPLVLKPTLGYGSWGVVKVNTVEQLEKEFIKIIKLSQENFNCNDILIEEYLDGAELIIDSIIHNGEIIFTNIIEKPMPMDGDNGFAEIEFITPTSFSEQDIEMIRQVNQDLNGKLKMINAISHVEMRLTAQGPKLLEINPRLPGAKNVDITYHTTGMDLELASIELAYGKCPELQAGKNGFAGFRIITPKKGGILNLINGMDEIKEMPEILEVSILKTLGQPVLQLPYEIQDFIGFIVAKGANREEVLNALEKAESMLEVEII